MADFITRAEELRRLLGMSQGQFCVSIGKDRSAFSQWRKTGGTERATLMQISERFLVDVDSLLGMPGTNHLEPSPVLRQAHLTLLDSISLLAPPPATPGDRLMRGFELLAERVPNLEEPTWAAYLHLSLGDWLEITRGFRQPDDEVLRGAAHLLGWYELKGAWLSWLVSGSTTDLQAAQAAEIERIVTRLGRMGVIIADMVEAQELRVLRKNSHLETK